jgi:hypothetical protein
MAVITLEAVVMLLSRSKLYPRLVTYKGLMNMLIMLFYFNCVS